MLLNQHNNHLNPSGEHPLCCFGSNRAGSSFAKGLLKKMDAIEKRASSALGKPEALHEWILVNKVQLDARIAAIKLLDKIDDGVDAYNAALSDTQALAEELLYAEVRLGKMLAAIDKKIAVLRETCVVLTGEPRRKHFQKA